MNQKRSVCFQEIESKAYRDEIFVDLTIYDVPASLLEEFAEKVVRSDYPSGVNEAIKDTLRKAIQEHQENVDLKRFRGSEGVICEGETLDS